MNILEIIRKKRDAQTLDKKEIEFFIKNYTNDKITDYQAAALIMAIFINGMNEEETVNLTLAMANSGEILDLSNIGKNIIEKHSTGGVGDKVSLILLPTVASLGIPVAKTSGRGLGFTGGTIDKLDSIPRCKTELSKAEFIEGVKKIGISIMAQTKNIAPADKKIYALRDTISCVENISLIASSIMSKKIASGANKIVLEITVGSGAMMKNLNDAKLLANEMIKIGKLANRETICVLTNMDEPLGHAIGNNLEVIEAINFLKGNMTQDLKEVILELGAYMIMLDGRSTNIKENKKMMLENIKNGKAYNKFVELIKNQGGDISYIENPDNFKKSKYIEKLYSNKSGYLKSIDTEKIGEISKIIGAGRIQKYDKIDYEVGIIINKKIGDYIKNGEEIAAIHLNDKEKLEKTKQQLVDLFILSDDKTEKIKNIIEIVK